MLKFARSSIKVRLSVLFPSLSARLCGSNNNMPISRYVALEKNILAMQERRFRSACPLQQIWINVSVNGVHFSASTRSRKLGLLNHSPIHHLRDLELANLDPARQQSIHLLIGSDLFGSLIWIYLLCNLRQGPLGTPTAQKIVFGSYPVLQVLLRTMRTRLRCCFTFQDETQILYYANFGRIRRFLKNYFLKKKTIGMPQYHKNWYNVGWITLTTCRTWYVSVLHAGPAKTMRIYH